MDISLIIVHYCQINFLISLLIFLDKSSIIWNKYKVEILVIDNFSAESENLRQIISQEENKISCICQSSFTFLDKNYGPSYARNRGVELAEGKYIQFIDVDDWIEPAKIPIQYEFAINNGYPSFVASQWAKVKAESSWNNKLEVSIHQPKLEEPIPLSLIKSDGFIPLMAGLIKKEAFLKSGGFQEEMWLVEDVRLLIDLYRVEPNFAVCYTSSPLFFYRIGQSHSLSKSSEIKFCDACYSNIAYVENLLYSQNDILSNDDKQILIESYGGLARFYFEYDRSKFFEVLQRIKNLNSNYLPSSPKILRQLSKWLGYEQAEAIALAYRKTKRILAR
jgi:glycosyltransferase involved in cell wall biosynthesis